MNDADRQSVFVWPLLLLIALLVLAFGDMSGDYVYIGEDAALKLFPEARPVIVGAITGIVGFLALLGVLRLLTGTSRLTLPPCVAWFLMLFLSVALFGAAIGLIHGVAPQFVLGDSQNSLLYLGLFALAGLTGERSVTFFRALLIVACSIALLKLGLSLASGVLNGRGLSWRYLVKASFFLPSLMFVAMATCLATSDHRRRRRFLLIAGLSAIGIFAASERGMFLGTAVGLVALLFLSAGKGPDFRKVALVSVLVMALGVVFASIQQSDVSDVFGHWSDESFQRGLAYRQRELASLMGMFREHWVAGSGLGAFDPHWEGYEDWLPRPYLVELEFPNLLAKLGVVGFAVWCASFLCLFAECIRQTRRRRNPERSALVAGLTAGLVSQMIESATNTLYSSILFHIYLLLLLLVLCSDVPPETRERTGNVSQARSEGYHLDALLETSAAK